MDFESTQILDLSSDLDDVEDEPVKRKFGELLVYRYKENEETKFPIYRGKNIIGRDTRCDICIPVQAISKKHACIETSGDQFLLYDFGSRNKTRKGKMILQSGVRYELKNDDIVTLADLRCQFYETQQTHGNISSSSDSETGSESMLPESFNESRQRAENNDSTVFTDVNADIFGATQNYLAPLNNDKSKDVTLDRTGEDNYTFAADTDSDTDLDDKDIRCYAHTPEVEDTQQYVIEQTPGFPLKSSYNDGLIKDDRKDVDSLIKDNERKVKIAPDNVEDSFSERAQRAPTLLYTSESDSSPEKPRKPRCRLQILSSPSMEEEMIDDQIATEAVMESDDEVTGCHQGNTSVLSPAIARITEKKDDNLLSYVVKKTKKTNSSTGQNTVRFCVEGQPDTEGNVLHSERTKQTLHVQGLTGESEREDVGGKAAVKKSGPEKVEESESTQLYSYDPDLELEEPEEATDLALNSLESKCLTSGKDKATSLHGEDIKHTRLEPRENEALFADKDMKNVYSSKNLANKSINKNNTVPSNVFEASESKEFPGTIHNLSSEHEAVDLCERFEPSSTTLLPTFKEENSEMIIVEDDRLAETCRDVDVDENTSSPLSPFITEPMSAGGLVANSTLPCDVDDNVDGKTVRENAGNPNFLSGPRSSSVSDVDDRYMEATQAYGIGDMDGSPETIDGDVENPSLSEGRTTQPVVEATQLCDVEMPENLTDVIADDDVVKDTIYKTRSKSQLDETEAHNFGVTGKLSDAETLTCPVPTMPVVEESQGYDCSPVDGLPGLNVCQKSPPNAVALEAELEATQAYDLDWANDSAEDESVSPCPRYSPLRSLADKDKDCDSTFVLRDTDQRTAASGSFVSKDAECDSTLSLRANDKKTISSASLADKDKECDSTLGTDQRTVTSSSFSKKDNECDYATSVRDTVQDINAPSSIADEDGISTPSLRETDHLIAASVSLPIAADIDICTKVVQSENTKNVTRQLKGNYTTSSSNKHNAISKLVASAISVSSLNQVDGEVKPSDTTEENHLQFDLTALQADTEATQALDFDTESISQSMSPDNSGIPSCSRDVTPRSQIENLHQEKLTKPGELRDKVMTANADEQGDKAVTRNLETNATVAKPLMEATQVYVTDDVGTSEVIRENVVPSDVSHEISIVQDEIIHTTDGVSTKKQIKSKDSQWRRIGRKRCNQDPAEKEDASKNSKKKGPSKRIIGRSEVEGASATKGYSLEDVDVHMGVVGETAVSSTTGGVTIDVQEEVSGVSDDNISTKSTKCNDSSRRRSSRRKGGSHDIGKDKETEDDSKKNISKEKFGRSAKVGEASSLDADNNENDEDFESKHAKGKASTKYRRARRNVKVTQKLSDDGSKGGDGDTCNSTGDVITPEDPGTSGCKISNAKVIAVEGKIESSSPEPLTELEKRNEAKKSMNHPTTRKSGRKRVANSLGALSSAVEVSPRDSATNDKTVCLRNSESSEKTVNVSKDPQKESALTGSMSSDKSLDTSHGIGASKLREPLTKEKPSRRSSRRHANKKSEEQEIDDVAVGATSKSKEQYTDSSSDIKNKELIVESGDRVENTQDSCKSSSLSEESKGEQDRSSLSVSKSTLKETDVSKESRRTRKRGRNNETSEPFLVPRTLPHVRRVAKKETDDNSDLSTSTEQEISVDTLALLDPEPNTRRGRKMKRTRNIDKATPKDGSECSSTNLMSVDRDFLSEEDHPGKEPETSQEADTEELEEMGEKEPSASACAELTTPVKQGKRLARKRERVSPKSATVKLEEHKSVKKRKTSDENNSEDDNRIGRRHSRSLTPLMKSPSLRSGLREVPVNPRVLFTGLTDKCGEKVAGELGAELVNSVYDATHLVTDKVRRTVKFLCCLGRGIPIVDKTWLDFCKQTGTFLPPSKYIVQDKTSEKQYKFNLQRSIEKAAQQPLLQGFELYVTKSVKPEPKQMKDIIQCAGGKNLANIPDYYSRKVIIIGCEEDSQETSKAFHNGFDIYIAELLLTGILRQELNFELYRLPRPVCSSTEREKNVVTGRRKRK